PGRHIYRRDEELDLRRTFRGPFNPSQVLVNLAKGRPKSPLAAQELCAINDQEYAGWSEAKRARGRFGEFLRPYPVSLRDAHLVALHLPGDGLNVNVREECAFHGVFSR